MVFYILTPHKIQAYEDKLSDFIADDLSFAIEQFDTKIATNQEHLSILKKSYPHYHNYEVKVGRAI